MYFENGEVKVCEGGYDQYIENRVAPEKSSEKKRDSENKNLYLKRKEDASRLRKLKTAFSRAEQEIEKTEAEIEEISNQLSDTHVSADYVKVSELTEKAALLEKKLEELLLEWETLGAELEETK